LDDQHDIIMDIFFSYHIGKINR